MNSPYRRIVWIPSRDYSAKTSPLPVNKSRQGNERWPPLVVRPGPFYANLCRIKGCAPRSMKMGNTHSLWRYDLALKALPLSADARRSRHSLYEAATKAQPKGFWP
jgi:hypothetical protein